MRLLRVCLTCLLSAVIWSAGANDVQGRVITYGNVQDGRVLVIGCVTNNPKYNYGRMQGIAEYILEHMRDLGVDAVEVFTVDKPSKMTRLLRDGHVDWVSATPFTAVNYLDEGDGRLLLAKAQRGQAWYRSVIITRKDSGIASLSDLLGKSIAFEKPDSTTAYAVPRAMLRAANLPLRQLRTVNEDPPSDAVGYLFSGDESNSVLWVHKGIVAAAAFSDADWKSNWIMPEALRNDLTIFAQSDRIPRSVEIVSRDLPDNIMQRLKQTLLQSQDDPDAQAALNQYYRATGFAEIDDEIRHALNQVRAFASQPERAIAP